MVANKEEDGHYTMYTQRKTQSCMLLLDPSIHEEEVFFDRPIMDLIWAHVILSLISWLHLFSFEISQAVKTLRSYRGLCPVTSGASLWLSVFLFRHCSWHCHGQYFKLTFPTCVSHENFLGVANSAYMSWRGVQNSMQKSFMWSNFYQLLSRSCTPKNARWER